MLVKLLVAMLLLVLVLSLLLCCRGTTSCGEDELFEGFGIYMGSANHFARTKEPDKVIEKVIETIYSDLKIRHFRMSYESIFSAGPHQYEIACDPVNNSWTCAWINLARTVGKYSDVSVFASIWSPPHYMKNEGTHTLLTEFEDDYYNFVTNITEMVKEQFDIDIERVSLVNEPENVFAPWEHTNMLPWQYCRMVRETNDPLVALCTENSYFWVSELYSSVGGCSQACEIMATHAYALHLNLFNPSDPDNLLAYYDKTPYKRRTTNPIWQTEVSSTFHNANARQLEEALDMSINIANFVGHTCIQRYYFWYSFTLGPSGESLIWGDEDGALTFPKKYFAYKHYTLAASGGKKRVKRCDPQDNVYCVLFGEDAAVFVNYLTQDVELVWNEVLECKEETFCCTTGTEDWNCTSSTAESFPYDLPGQSICSCQLTQKPTTSPATASSPQAGSTSQYSESTGQSETTETPDSTPGSAESPLKVLNFLFCLLFMAANVFIL